MNLYFRLITFLFRGRRDLDFRDTVDLTFTVRPTDLDVFRHLTNSRYFAFNDLARLDLLRRSGLWAKLRRRGWYPVVAAQTVVYRKPLRAGVRFRLRTRLLGVDDRDVFVEHVFLRADEVCAHAVVRIRFLKRTGGSVTHKELAELTGSLPAEPLPDWIQAWSSETRTAAVGYRE